MSLRRPTTARSIAAESLSEAQLRQEFAGETLDRYPQLTERQRATDLVFGVIRNRVVIDLVIEKFSSCSVERVPEKILNILRVAVFEIVYCPQAVEYAIVDEAVEYTKRVTNPKQAGFINAVLRQTLRHIISREKLLEQSHPRKTIPQAPDTGCEFNIEMLPDRDVSPLDYLSVAFSLPGWLVESWLAEYGLEQTKQIAFASNRRPSIYLRPNSTKTTAQQLEEKLKAADIDCEIIDEFQMIGLRSPKSITALPGFKEGLFSVQDLSAAQAVRLLKPQPDWLILDLCAAPGTKTTQLAEATEGKAKIVATDIDNARLKMVNENISRLDLAGSVTVIEYHALDKYFKKQGEYDCVLVDAPCSNTGVLARRPEVRHRITERAVEELTRIQADLLCEASEMLKPKGVLCYSTCSIQPAENGLLVKRFLQENPGFTLKEEKLILPSAKQPDHDGSYAAIMEKKEKG